MNEEKKDYFYIELEETISLGLLAAYGKIYSGKYTKKSEGYWENTEDSSIKIVYENSEKHYTLLDEHNNTKIDISETAEDKDPHEVKWGKCGVSIRPGKDSVEYRRWVDRSEEFSFLNDPAPSASTTTTIVIVPTATATETPTATATSTATGTATGTVTVTGTATGTATATGTITATATRTNTATGTDTPTSSQSSTPSISISPTSSQSNTPSTSITPTPSQSSTPSTSTTPTPSCTELPSWNGPEERSPENCPSCWEEYGYDDCCPFTASSTDTPLQPIETVIVSPGSTPSSTSTPSDSCTPIIFPEEEIREGKPKDFSTLVSALSYSKLDEEKKRRGRIRDIRIRDKDGKETPLELVTHLNYCTTYELNFPGGNVEDFGIIEDEGLAWPTEKPFFNCRTTGTIVKSKPWLEFSIQPTFTGEPTIIKWQYNVNYTPAHVCTGSTEQPETPTLTATQTITPSSTTSNTPSESQSPIPTPTISLPPPPPPPPVPTPSESITITKTEAEYYCWKGKSYKYLGDNCPCPTASLSPDYPIYPYPTATSTQSSTITESSSVTPNSPSETETESETPCGHYDSYVRVGWFIISDLHCSVSRAEDLRQKASTYNRYSTENQKHRLDFGKIYIPGTNRKERVYDEFSEETPWGCGGKCTYEWQINCNTQILEGNVCLIPQSGVVGPIKHCSQEEPLLFNSWVTSENLGECVSISDDKVIKMSYFIKSAKDQCGCEAAKHGCPDWTGDDPSPPQKAFLPLCKTDTNNPTQPAEEKAIDFETGTFRILDESVDPAVPSNNYIKLYIDEEGWPIELVFPEEAFKNGGLDPSSTAYLKTVNEQSPPFQYYSVVFYDEAGKGWVRSGYFLTV